MTAPATVPGPIVAALCASGRAEAGRLVILPGPGAVPFDDIAPAPCRRPLLSPDGRRVAFELNGDVALAMLDDPGATTIVLAPCLQAEPGCRTFQFDATGQWLAVAVPGGVLVLPASPAGGDGRRVALPAGLQPAHLVWSERGHTLAVTARSEDGEAATVWLDPMEGRPLALARDSEVLAVPNDEVVWTVEPCEGRPAGQASMLERARFRPAVYAAPDDRMIAGWLPGRFEVLLSGFAEDAGDGADMVAMSIGGGEARPLIQGLQGVRAVTVSPDGGWLTALLDDDPTAVHLFPVSGDEPTRLALLPAQDDSDEPLLVAEAMCAGPAAPSGGPAWR